MARKKLIRRCEPRYGVSEEILATEALYVAREVDDYRILSVAELNKKLAERQSLWLKADGSLQVQVEVLPERERQIVHCLLVRDIYHLLELYATYLRNAFPGASGTVSSEPEPRADEEKAEERSVPFSEWLFRS